MSKHEGVIALSSRKQPVAEPAPAPVNTHPGPDFPRKATA